MHSIFPIKKIVFFVIHFVVSTCGHTVSIEIVSYKLKRLFSKLFSLICFMFCIKIMSLKFIEVKQNNLNYLFSNKVLKSNHSDVKYIYS